MVTNARLLFSVLGLLALATSPVMANTNTKHVQTYRNQTGQASGSVRSHFAPPVFGLEGAYAYEPGFRLPSDFQHRGYDGYQHDRQLVGLGDF
jgi:hypothetical protein